MAGISTLSGFDYRGQQPNFSRDMFNTVAEMVAFSENYLPDVFITQVVENGKTYKYQRSNIVDADLGKWRELEGGGVNFSEYVSKVTDVVSTYSGDEADTSKIPDISAMKALDTKLQGNIDGKVDNTYDVSKAGQVLVVGEDGNVTLKDSSVLGGNAEVVTYENAEYPDLNNVDKALDKILAKIYYVEPKINSFTMTPSATEYEKGAVVSGLEFAWTVNKDIVSQSLTDCTIELDDRTATYGADLTSTKTFTLTISDGEKSDSVNKKISFLPKIYYGSTTEPTDYDSAFALGLSNSVLASSSKRDYSFNCGVGEYSYIVCPTTMTFNTIWVNGFQAEINKLITIALTNASGHTESYDVLRFANSGLGSFVGTVK